MTAPIDFCLATVVTLASSALLVTRLERVGTRLGFTPAILGLATAFAANAPEMTSAITALVRGQNEIGVGVVLGSNVFNLAALLGLGAMVAGRIDLHRRVVTLVGGVSLWIALVTFGTVTTNVSVPISLAFAMVIFVPYVVISAWPRSPKRRGSSTRSRTWMRLAIREEEEEIADALHATPGDWRDASVAALALAVVILASVVMEHAATSLGHTMGWSNVVVGAVVLAGVTSLPNAVAAVYFAARGRGTVVLSEALNSNNLNALFGFMVPAAFLGLHHPGSPDLIVAGFYLGLTALALVLVYARRGLGRLSGAIIIAGYVAFVATIVR